MGRGPTYKQDQIYGDWAWSSANFWRKVERSTPDACWTWTGSRGPAGPLFGAYKTDSEGKRYPRMTQARRILYAEHTGKMLEPKQPIYHSCCNSDCMNPLHQTLLRTNCTGIK